MLKRHVDKVKSANAKNPSSLSVSDLERYTQDWLFDGEFHSHSPKTTQTRRIFVKNLLWFLTQYVHSTCGKQELKGIEAISPASLLASLLAYSTCGKQELKAFFIYLSQPQPQGRWGSLRFTQPSRPVSIKDYFMNFRIMFRWFLSEGLSEASPMDALPLSLPEF